jgi:energy-coupling factor transporter ATP-binding protein EcfA2
MSTLADYNPLAQIVLPNNLSISPRGLIVLVGPNSSGKTQFLTDIASHLAGHTTRRSVVCSSITSQAPSDPAAFLNDLIKRRYLLEIPNTGCHLNVPVIPLIDKNPQPRSNQLPRQALEQAIAEFRTGKPDSNDLRRRGGFVPNPFLPFFGPTLLAFLPTEARIKATESVQKKDINQAHMAHPM